MAAEALQSLNRILQYRQQREESRVSQALAFMELSERRKVREMQVRQQNIAVMSANLELMQKHNETMKIRSAENFLQQTGLSGLYSKYKDEDDGLTKAVDELSGKPGLWGEDDYSVEMNREVAADLISATWAAFEQQNPNAIINIGAKLHFLDDPEAQVISGSYEEKLFKSFNKLGYLKVGQDNSSVINSFKTMRKTLDNEINITKELEGFLKGDYQIDEDFTFIDETLNKLDMESIKRAIPTADVIPTLGGRIEQIGGRIEDHEEKIKANRILIENLDQLEADVSFYASTDPDYKISPEDSLQIKHKDITKIELSKEIDASLTAIATLKETEGKFAAEESRRGLVEKMEKGWLVDIPF
jgi:hypothetical protein